MNWSSAGACLEQCELKWVSLRPLQLLPEMLDVVPGFKFLPEPQYHLSTGVHLLNWVCTIINTGALEMHAYSAVLLWAWLW
jgi:hypothetical protein